MFWAKPTLLKASVPVMAVGLATLSMSVNDPAVPVVLNCHWIVGVGLPVAAAVNVTAVPEVATWFAGSRITAGGASTARVTAVEVQVPELLVKIARYA